MEPVKKYSRDEVAQAVRHYYQGSTNGDVVDSLAKGLQRENAELSYRDALHKILQVRGNTDSNLSPARQEMNELLGDRVKCQRLAGDAVDRRVRQRLTKFAQQSYREVLGEIARQYPALWTAYQDGILRDGDFSTLALLLPSSERGNYADETTVVKKYDLDLPA